MPRYTEIKFNRHLLRYRLPSTGRIIGRIIDQVLNPTPSREIAKLPFLRVINPGVYRKGIIGAINEFLTPRVNRQGWFNAMLAQVLKPEPPRSGILAPITAVIDAPVFRLSQGGEHLGIVRPRLRNPTFLQRFISAINEVINAYPHLEDLLGHYIDVFTPTDEFKAALERTVLKTRADIQLLGENLLSGRISPEQYHNAMVKAIRRLHISTMIIGARGIGNLTPDILEAVDRRITEQINFLNNFMVDSFGPNFTRSLGQTGMSEKMFLSRSLRYASAGRGTGIISQYLLMDEMYSAGMLGTGGMLFMRRIRIEDDKSCDDCIGYADAGWVNAMVNPLPLPTENCACSGNCRCGVQYALATNANEIPDDIAY